MFATVKRLLQQFKVDVMGDRVHRDPVRHYFPDVGRDGEITIDCVITPSPGAHREVPPGDEKLHDWRHGVPSKCVGAMVVELDQFGLRFRWKPGQLNEQSFLSPFAPKPGGQPSADPSKDGGNDGHEKPLQRTEIEVHDLNCPSTGNAATLGNKETQ